jgi:hypothetical protein
MASFKYVRLYPTPNGESHFEDVEIPLPDPRMISDTMPLTAWNIRSNGPGYDLDFHTAPRRQFIVNLSGEVEIEASDGEKRRFGPGTIMLVEDTTGKGHRSKAISQEERVSLWLHAPEGAPK